MAPAHSSKNLRMKKRDGVDLSRLFLADLVNVNKNLYRYIIICCENRFWIEENNHSCVTSFWNIEEMVKRIIADLVRNKLLFVCFVLISILIVKPYFKVDKTVELHFKENETVPASFRVLVHQDSACDGETLSVQRLSYLHEIDGLHPDRDWMIYSFDVPPGEGNFDHYSRSINYSVERISAERQLVKLTETGNKFYSESHYEREFENIYPIYHKHFDTRGPDPYYFYIALLSLAALFVIIKQILSSTVFQSEALSVSAKKYIKFAIISAAVLALPYSCAFTSDMFGTAMVSTPVLIFFAVRFLVASAKAIQKKQVRYNLIIMGACLLIIPSLIAGIKISNRGLSELTQKRMQIMKELKPVFAEYKTENGEYPDALQDLVPEYIAEIPAELVNDGKDDPYKKIYYTLSHEGPVFYFKTIRGPDASASYNVDTGTLWHDQ